MSELTELTEMADVTELAEPTVTNRPLDDQAAMNLAIEVAARSRLWTAPNPWVGAVLLDAQRRVIATGRTQPPGGPHAEAVALREAGDLVRGSQSGLPVGKKPTGGTRSAAEMGPASSIKGSRFRARTRKVRSR